MHVNITRKFVLNCTLYVYLCVIECQTRELVKRIVLYNIVNISFDLKIIQVSSVIDKQS